MKFVWMLNRRDKYAHHGVKLEDSHKETVTYHYITWFNVISASDHEHEIDATVLLGVTAFHIMKRSKQVYADIFTQKQWLRKRKRGRQPTQYGRSFHGFWRRQNTFG